ncbi:hypothetical protein CRG98_033188 [Punica granatum]|uniref:GH3 C-terminal domain-containing protein n=1 Tax=Punica granatum TaxID=22663 RepID=A0A2I0IQZ4_PUNGR|nr:hypothetical protein CRG98_033188 [Punica granatum]
MTQQVSIDIESGTYYEYLVSRTMPRSSSSYAGERGFGATVIDYTSRADTSSIPGHCIIYWEIHQTGSTSTPIHSSVLEECCLIIVESLNSVNRQGRTTVKSIGPLEIKVVGMGTFDKLMDCAIS